MDEQKRHFDFNEEELSGTRRHILTGANYKTVVDQIIHEAQERGDFENLPGKGKPLDLEENHWAGDMQLAYKMLKDNNFTLPWIADRNDMVEEIQAVRDKIKHQWQLFGPQVLAMANGGQLAMAERRYTALMMQWETAIGNSNRRIRDINHSIPVVKLKLVPLHLSTELTRIGAKPSLAEMRDSAESNPNNKD